MTLGIYGSGGVGREAEELARLLQKWNEIVFIDDIAEPGIFHNVKRIPFRQFQQHYTSETSEVIIAVVEPTDREDLFIRIHNAGYSFTNLIHPESHVSSSAQLGTGIMIQKSVFIGCDVVIGNNVHIEPGVFIGHDSIVEDHCVFASKAALGGKTSVGQLAFIGLGASVRDRVSIGKRAIIGMGTVVIEEVPENSVAIGNPARIMKQVQSRKVFTR